MAEGHEMNVLDASAVLAFLHTEDGHDRVGNALPNGIVSLVNLAEVLQKFVRRGKPMEGIASRLSRIGVRWDRPVEEDVALVADLGAIKNLSLADRFCVAAGRRLSLPVMTADRAWKKLDLPVEVELIR